MSTTRRTFLKQSALGVSVSFFAPQMVSSLLAADGSGKILVVLQLDGGNDAVNTFIPYADPRYRALRPTLAIPDGQILKVDDRIGLHPSMGKMKTLYEQRKLAIINNVGFPTLDRSHFRCRDVWQTADDSYGQVQRGVTGWLGRYADTYLAGQATALTSVSIGNRNALGLVSNEVTPTAVADAASFDVLTDTRYPADRTAYIQSIRTIYGLAQAKPEQEIIREQGSETFAAVDLLKTIPPPSTSAAYPANAQGQVTALGRAFQLAAQLIAGNVGTHAIWISTGGYDTHSQQPDTHSGLLGGVSESLAAFDADLASRGLSDRVMVLAWSEFGRRVQENASLGPTTAKRGRSS